MKSYFISLFLIFSLNSLSAQQAKKCNCCDKNHHAFDFWLGDWNVYDTTGTKVGENHIVKLQDSCVLQENWTSAALTGTSYNYYNQKDSTWNQLWLDNAGGSLILKGNIENGAMVMKSKLMKGRKVPWYYNQIIWTPREDGSVTQEWAVHDKSGKVLKVIFYGIYKREK